MTLLNVYAGLAGIYLLRGGPRDDVIGISAGTGNNRDIFQGVLC
jgi:hypothetical protein